MPRSPRQGAIPSELGWLIDTLDELASRLDTLEAPSGESLNSTVAKLQDLVSDITATLNAYIATRYTNAQIDTLVNARAPLSHTHDQSQVTGTWDKAVSTASGIYAAGAITFPNVYATDLTGTRRTGWVQSDGRMGYASSSRTKKTAIRPADEASMLAILDVDAQSFYYRQEIRRRTLARINAGEDFTPARETGWIAEQLEELGLGWLVYHDEDGNPEGIEYAMAVVALLAVGRDHERRLRDLEGK